MPLVKDPTDVLSLELTTWHLNIVEVQHLIGNLRGELCRVGVASGMHQFNHQRIILPPSNDSSPPPPFLPFTLGAGQLLRTIFGAGSAHACHGFSKQNESSFNAPADTKHTAI